MVLIELGVARAFIKRGVKPAVVAGVSAGAFTAVAHALDPSGGRGVESAARVLGQVNDGTLGLRWWQIALHLVLVSRRSLGDPGRLRRMLGEALARDFGLRDARVGDLAQPPVRIGASDRLTGEPVWFPPQTRLVDAVIASSAIPGVFPWVEMEVGGSRRTLVDGGLVSNQPLSELVFAGCGTIFAVSVGPARRHLEPPHNLVDNVIGSTYLAVHSAQRLEEAYVGQLLGDRGRILHVHPPLDLPVNHFNFNPTVVREVIDEADRLTQEWLAEQGY